MSEANSAPDDPFAFDLLTLSTAHLRNHVAPGLDGEARYNLLLAARAAEIAWRDRALEKAREEAARAVARIMDDGNPAMKIRNGGCDGDASLHGALLAMTAIATYSTRPDILDPQERDEVEGLKA